MTRSPRRKEIRWVFVIAVAYVVIGIATAELSGAAATTQGRTVWRLAAWLLSFIAFAGHVVYDRLGGSSTAGSTARHAAVAVALGALGLALVGPVRSHWAAPEFTRTVLLSVVVWPFLTGVPAFVVAYVAALVLGRAMRSRSPSISAGAPSN